MGVTARADMLGTGQGRNPSEEGCQKTDSFPREGGRGGQDQLPNLQGLAQNDDVRPSLKNYQEF